MHNLSFCFLISAAAQMFSSSDWKLTNQPLRQPSFFFGLLSFAALVAKAVFSCTLYPFCQCLVFANAYFGEHLFDFSITLLWLSQITWSTTCCRGCLLVLSCTLTQPLLLSLDGNGLNFCQPLLNLEKQNKLVGTGNMFSTKIRRSFLQWRHKKYLDFR